jgi:hypothetical protein
MAFYEKQKRKQVTSGYKIKMSGLHHGLLVRRLEGSNSLAFRYSLFSRVPSLIAANLHVHAMKGSRSPHKWSSTQFSLNRMEQSAK